MKKIICILTVLIISLSAFPTHVSAEKSESWYIKRGENGSAPSFPPSAEYVKANNGFYIDEEAREEGRKVLYLTFDAGYENGNIAKILDVMKEKNVTSAFFVLNNLVCKNPELIKRMQDEGHLLCNHTKNHKDLTTLTDEEVGANLKALEDSCLENTGASMSKFFRFPEGKFSKEKLALCSELGYTTVFWSIAYADWDNANQLSEDAAFDKLMNQTHPGAIILLHPTSETNARIMGRLIDTWREMGYEFGSLNDIIK